MELTGKVVITGGAGLVGQNLIERLARRHHRHVVAIDKNKKNASILARLQPHVQVIEADLASRGNWEEALVGCEALVIGHAQIGGLRPEEFKRNNVEATRILLNAAATAGVSYIVNISSSVVNSLAVDNYTETKKAQERLIQRCGIPQVILRPTLMFGWYDRKHLGWLARFMEKVPVFPIPGKGRYMRQPLYVGDFCEVIISAIEKRITGAYNISGREKIDYIDLMREVRSANGLKTPIIKVPYSAFWTMLGLYGLFRKSPPFTTKQLRALVTPDEFEVIDWPGVFGVQATPLREALAETFQHPIHSKVVLQF